MNVSMTRAQDACIVLVNTVKHMKPNKGDRGDTEVVSLADSAKTGKIMRIVKASHKFLGHRFV